MSSTPIWQSIYGEHRRWNLDDHFADAVLPVVERIAREAAAKALRDTADDTRRTASAGDPMSAADRDALVAAIDELHELSWTRGEMGHGSHARAADALARALGWDGEPGTTPDGHWLRSALNEALR